MHKTYIFTSVDSTNRVAFELAQKGVAHGTAVLAERQISGRGRLARSWHSPEKMGLYCSIIVRPNIPVEEYHKLTLAAGLSVAQALDKTCGCKSSVKWPNDIYIKGRKVGGILTEAALFPTNSSVFAVVGIGVNINNKQEDLALEIAKRATSIFLETGKQNVIQAVFQAIRTEILKDILIFEKKGFCEILGRWKERDMLQGKAVRWMKQSGEVICGISQGPDLQGRLLVQDEAGMLHKVISGDVLLQEPL